jgi:hypothetical protein
MYTLVDTFFYVFHSVLILFILSGWSWGKTRGVHLIVVSMTAFSWFVLGIWYGFGFCPSTEWHWQIRAELGEHDLPSSYIKFLVDSLSGLDVNAKLVDSLTLILFAAASFASIWTNVRGWKTKGRWKKGKE